MLDLAPVVGPCFAVDPGLLPFQFSREFWALRYKLLQFMDEHIYPNEATYYAQREKLIKVGFLSTFRPRCLR